MTLAKGWPHDAGENRGTWPHEGGDWHLRDEDGKRLQNDHFVPGSRHPENAIENLIPLHERCNSQKQGHFLAATVHVRPWRKRLERQSGDLRLIAEQAGFEHDPTCLLSITRSIYVRLPAGALLWVRGDEFEAVGDSSFPALLAATQSS